MLQNLFKLIIGTVLVLFKTCNIQGHDDPDITFTSSGDTSQVNTYYQSGKLKQVIYYKDNEPDTSLAFTMTGDTIYWPNLIYSEDSGHLMVYIPVKQYGACFLEIQHVKDSNSYVPLYTAETYNGDLINLKLIGNPHHIKASITCYTTDQRAVHVYPIEQYLAYPDEDL